ncbi:MAG: winged helix-turn-helix transcriptional regulator [Clostridia bacterium]|nr:winged helix-turn-helix transcriptional regulator [Clostridia bacterium]
MRSSLTEIFKVLSDENRLKIVKALAKESMCACQLLEGLGISQPTLSHHMKILTDAGLVEPRKQKTQVYYDLNREQVSSLCGFVREISCHGNNCLNHIDA